MSLRRMLRWALGVPLYPLLAAAYPVVFLYARNVEQAIPPTEVLLPLVVSTGASLVVLLLLARLTRQAAAAGLMSTLLVVLFFTYGLTWNWLSSMLVGHWVLLTAWLLLAAAGLGLIWRLRAHAWRATAPLNAAAAALLVLNLISISTFLLNIRPADAAHGSGVTASGVPTQGVARPDIYWVVLEEYGSQQVIAKDFGYDNTPFLDALRARGFSVQDRSTANYLKTAPSLLSARNLTYLDGAALRTQARSDGDWGPVYNGLQSSFEVQEFLNGLGYRFLYAGMYWSPTRTQPLAEINYTYEGLNSEFLETLEGATILRALSDLGTQAPFDWRRDRWDQTEYELQAVQRAATIGGPKLLIAHFALDHEPYVFHADGSFITDDDARNLTHEQQYVEQLKFTNTQMLAWVDQLLDVPSDQQPIIVLLGDEGPWPAGYREDELNFDWTTATAADLQQKFGIINAVYLPGMTADQVGLYPTITPVNEFRVLFDAYFGLNLPLLPDRNYIWPNQNDIYDYIDVTEKVAR